jgi:hypothetical protein
VKPSCPAVLRQPPDRVELTLRIVEVRSEEPCARSHVSMNARHAACAVGCDRLRSQCC